MAPTNDMHNVGESTQAIKSNFVYSFVNWAMMCIKEIALSITDFVN